MHVSDGQGAGVERGGLLELNWKDKEGMVGVGAPKFLREQELGPGLGAGDLSFGCGEWCGALNLELSSGQSVGVRICEDESGTCFSACDKSRDLSAQLLPGDISLFPNTPSRDRAKLRSNLFSTGIQIFLQFGNFTR
jgi:hypothetical protein